MMRGGSGRSAYGVYPAVVGRVGGGVERVRVLVDSIAEVLAVAGEVGLGVGEHLDRLAGRPVAHVGQLLRVLRAQLQPLVGALRDGQAPQVARVPRDAARAAVQSGVAHLQLRAPPARLRGGHLVAHVAGERDADLRVRHGLLARRQGAVDACRTREHDLERRLLAPVALEVAVEEGQDARHVRLEVRGARRGPERDLVASGTRDGRAVHARADRALGEVLARRVHPERAVEPRARLRGVLRERVGEVHRERAALLLTGHAHAVAGRGRRLEAQLCVAWDLRVRRPAAGERDARLQRRVVARLRELDRGRAVAGPAAVQVDGQVVRCALIARRRVSVLDVDRELQRVHRGRTARSEPEAASQWSETRSRPLSFP